MAMELNDFVAYVRESLRQGLDYGQIASKLGMKRDEFEALWEEANQRLYHEEEIIQKLKEKHEKPKAKPVSGAGEVKKPDMEGIFFIPQSD